MEALQPVAKIFTSTATLAPRECIAIFHRWIQRGRLPGMLLLDVVDYSHVSDDPVVLLVAHEGFLSLDREHQNGAETRLGLQWRVRRGEPVPAAEGLRAAVRTLLPAAAAFEEDAGGKIRFAPGELQVGFDDRAGAPNDAATFAALSGDLQAVARSLYPDGSAAPSADPKSCFRASLHGSAASLAELITRAG